MAVRSGSGESRTGARNARSGGNDRSARNPRAAATRQRTARAVFAVWLTLTAAVVGLLLGVGGSDCFLIRDVRVYCPDESLRDEAAEQAGRLEYRTIWLPPSRDIERSIGGLARARGVQIERELPATLIIRVLPRLPVAVVQVEGRCMLVDEEGVCLNWTGRPDREMAMVRIADPSQLAVGATLDVRDREMFGQVLAGLREVGLAAGARVDLSAPRRIEIITADGVIGKLGDTELLREKAVLFGKLLDGLRSEHHEPLYIDLRVPSRPTYRPVN